MNWQISEALRNSQSFLIYIYYIATRRVLDDGLVIVINKYALRSEYPISSGIPTNLNIFLLKIDHEIVMANARQQMDIKPNPSPCTYS